MGEAQYNEIGWLIEVREGDEIKKINTNYAIVINENASDSSKASTIIHELAHILCGHLPKGKKQMINFPNRSRESLSEGQKEIEAEMVCELVYKTLSIEYANSGYKSQYLKENKNPEVSLGVAINAADKIMKVLNSN